MTLPADLRARIEGMYPAPPRPTNDGQPGRNVFVIAPQPQQAIWFCRERGWNPRRHVLGSPEGLRGMRGCVIYIYAGSERWRDGRFRDIEHWYHLLQGRGHTVIEWGSTRGDGQIAKTRVYKDY